MHTLYISNILIPSKYLLKAFGIPLFKMHYLPNCMYVYNRVAENLCVHSSLFESMTQNLHLIVCKTKAV